MALPVSRILFNLFKTMGLIHPPPKKEKRKKKVVGAAHINKVRRMGSLIPESLIPERLNKVASCETLRKKKILHPSSLSISADGC
jgi:hypothetical protein